MPRSDQEKMADEIASIRLLSGYDVDLETNAPFATHFSAEERELRAALARTIRDQMNGFSAELLALAIDPFTPSAWPDMRPARKVKFLAQGLQSTLFIEKQVIGFIRRMRASEKKPNVPIDAYVKAAEKKFKLKRSRIFAIWKAYENMIEAAGSSNK
ncbi:hypothetical protein CQ14_31020 [Bradyrhizobium lablabi]|uniref:Uncharacterized protein n=1 Tax=Bradyrhizobium lablabi TaxID=722472 RepID=A0A0R3MR24_9BRAD|nr:hypothetical protein [Bradyrhizobium lablabi]KRR22642.1 hypothetical protein CQ14_31020 [Bradyrhizobium lablabi]